MRVDENGNWRSFRHRNFRLLFTASVLTNIGTWAQRIAQDWLVLELTDNNGFALGLVTSIQFTPVLFFSLHGGALADRLDKRKLLIFTNIVGALSAYVLGFLVLSHHVQLWHVYICAAVLGFSGALDAPIRQAFTADIVGKSDLGNAISLNSANFNAGRLVGPALSGFLIARFGTGPSFIINATSFLFVISAMLALRKDEFHIEDTDKTRGTVREALRYVAARPDLYIVMTIVFFVATFGLNFQIFNALMATKVFHKGPASYGLLGTFMAIGSLSGALVSTRLERFRTPLFISRLAIIFSSAVVVISLLPNYTTYALWLPVCGITALTTLISANGYVQVNTDPAIRGRVMGIYLLIFMGGSPVGSLLIGWASEAIGTRAAFLICGIIPLLVSAAILAIHRARLIAPHDISVSGVLPGTYDDQR